MALSALANEIAALVPPGSRIALGTGATVTACLPALAAIPGVTVTPTSSAIAARAAEAGLKTVGISSSYDIYIDGVDQVTANGDAIKGSWGAHVREKSMAMLSQRRILVAARSKLVPRLAGPVPVAVLEAFADLYRSDPEANLPRHDNGLPDHDENGLALVTLASNTEIDDPAAWTARVEALAGVVLCGVFPAAFVDQVIIADENGQIDYIDTKSSHLH